VTSIFITTKMISN